MVNTKVQYIVYNHGGSGVRHHHFTTANDIISEADGHAADGDVFPAQGFPFQWFDGQAVPFAFMSVVGGRDGNQLYTVPGNQTVTVGTSDVSVLVVYAPPGGIGGPNGGPGVWVDAFNVDVGDFSDDINFIEVLNPPTPPDTVDAGKTTFANMEGVVSTLQAEDLRASPTVDGGVPFLEWKKIVPIQSVQTDPNVGLTQNETGEIWLAFYQRPAAGGSIGRVIRALEGGLVLFTGDDTCGNGGHVVPRPGGPGFALRIDEGVLAKLGPNQRQALQKYMKEYPATAGAGLVATNRVVDILRSADAILEGSAQGISEK